MPQKNTISPQRAQWLVEKSRPSQGPLRRMRRYLPLLAMGLAIGMMLSDQDRSPMWDLAIFVVLLAALGASWVFAWQARRLQMRHSLALQAAHLAQWPHAMELLDRLLSRPLDRPDMRLSSLLALAETAGAMGQHESAAVLYDELLAGPIDERTRQLALAGKAMALLSADRLTDAVGLLDGMRTMHLAEPMATLAAVANLHRQILVRGFVEAAQSADSLADRARTHLHRQAGQVYAMLALALEQTSQIDRAQAYYDCATRLFSVQELAERLPAVAGLELRLAPARSPL